MAAKNGLEMVENSYFTTDERSRHFNEVDRDDIQELGTVGAIVLDHTGALAAAGSTGGTAGKDEGRLGDTAILGAGLFADSDVATVCSGAGDAILQNMIAARLARYYSNGLSVADAADAALDTIASSGDTCAILALDPRGHASIASNARSFSVAIARHGRTPMISLWPATSTMWPQAFISEDTAVVAGLTTYPITPGHTKIQLRRHDACLLSLRDTEVTQNMMAAKGLATALTRAYHARRCALVSTGDRTLSLIPLHGLDDGWKPITSDVKEFHESYPGYITSHDGPIMSTGDLTSICSRIQAVSGLKEPFDNSFHGPESDSNLFARIIREELPQFRVWDDSEHVAFLTPFANTPGLIVLVPRSHKASDILGLDDDSYKKMILAAKKVAGVLAGALKVPRCGMIFEGFEID